MKQPEHCIIHKKGISTLLQVKSTCAKDFLLFGIFQTFPSGEFWSGDFMCRRFNAYRAECGLKPYALNTFDLAIGELRKLKVIAQLSRGLYIFNPEIIWRGKKEDVQPMIDKFKSLTENKSNNTIA